jgi:ActR/RegA family two-component response regulator
MGVDEAVNKILVLEDKKMYLMLLLPSLTKLGYAADVAVNVEEAQEYLAQNKYYAAILDDGVPKTRESPSVKGTGMEYAAMLRQQIPDLRIALHTGTKVDEPTIRRLKENNIIYLEKPAADEQLAEFLG